MRIAASARPCQVVNTAFATQLASSACARKVGTAYSVLSVSTGLCDVWTPVSGGINAREEHTFFFLISILDVISFHFVHAIFITFLNSLTLAKVLMFYNLPKVFELLYSTYLFIQLVFFLLSPFSHMQRRLPRHTRLLRPSWGMQVSYWCYCYVQL